MNSSSKTGLLASPTKKLIKTRKKKPLHLKAVAIPAPVILRPYAGLYNPYPYGCSLLCNHPTDKEAKDVLKRARETWATENKNVILPEEIQAIRDSLAYVDETNKPLPVECIPEELFRRYTETDSRPLTPAPTLASVKTRGSSSRRCVTPDPVINCGLRERTLLILDLRRSHSQEIISWQGTNEPPVINILQAPTPTISVDSYGDNGDIVKSRNSTAKTPKPQKQNEKLQVPKTNEQETSTLNPDQTEKTEDEDEIEEEIVKRKGKRRKKRGRDSSRGPLAVQASIDPETQVSALDNNKSGKLSSHPSLTKTGSIQDNTINNPNYPRRESIIAKNSILDPKTLKHLQRELNAEIIDLEFNNTKKAVLKEALRTIPLEQKPQSEEMIQIKKELNLVQINSEAWLSLPRIFSRKSCRFELPLISETLNTITPLQYLEKHTRVTKNRRLLYNIVFNRHKIIEDNNRILNVNKIQTALGEMMGKPLKPEQFTNFETLINCQNDVKINFKTWCGICALFERIYAKEFCAELPDKTIDPCDEVEIADFQSLNRRLSDVKTNMKIVEMLTLIKES